ncbi:MULTISPECIES: hypothetical protein [Caballeronia]|uniref:hypothetical protein n=1 Tax=Caballeronia TaxID=1827195 RepID=UPI002859A12B|nr:hypothetical protein [Caballeronia sp. LZ032]MDR5880486.1 hypothetical protein [Caballeronia sp. LZ032]
MLKRFFSFLAAAIVSVLAVPSAHATEFNIADYKFGEDYANTVRDKLEKTFSSGQVYVDGNDWIVKNAKVVGGVYNLRATFSPDDHKLKSITLDGKPQKSGALQGFARKTEETAATASGASASNVSASGTQVFTKDDIQASVTHKGGRVSVVYEAVPETKTDRFMTLLKIAAGIVVVLLAICALRYWYWWIAGLAIGYIKFDDLFMGAMLGAAMAMLHLVIAWIWGKVSGWNYSRKNPPLMKVKMSAEQFRSFQNDVRARTGAHAQQQRQPGVASGAGQAGQNDGALTRINPATGLPMVGMVDVEGNVEGHTPINPANGLPMLGGHGSVDVHGNTYGTNTNDFHAPM